MSEQPSVWELFQKNPREMTKEQREEVINVLRQRRAQWANELDNARKGGRRAQYKKKGASADSVLPGVDLSEIAKRLLGGKDEDSK